MADTRAIPNQGAATRVDTSAPVNPVQFSDVFRSEITSINEWRKKNARKSAELESEPYPMSDDTRPLRPTRDSEVVGIALSGGGVRSAAFCLGALQGLREADAIKKTDYLSTVSGGGYIGLSMSAGMTADGGHFPFKSDLSEDETPSLQHVRDHSNFLFPNGAKDLLQNGAIFVRGLVANAILVLLVLLLAAALTILSNPSVGSLQHPNVFGIPIPNIFGFPHFVITAYLALALLALVVIWAVVRSFKDAAGETSELHTFFVGRFALLVAFAAVCEVQPYVLAAMFALDQPGFWPAFMVWLQRIIALLTPVAVVVAFAARQFGDVMKSALESERIRDHLIGYAMKLGIYFAAAIVPILLWIIYIKFSYWGICPGASCDEIPAPSWLLNSAKFFAGFVPWIPESVRSASPGWQPYTLVIFYLLVAVACFLLSLTLRPNANSLHPLYRDRLGEAFLFQPQRVVPRDPGTGKQPPLAPLHQRMSWLSEDLHPYHLINTALNVQSSREVNKRGRNADFFLLSRNYTGSRATGYVPTTAIEGVMRGFDLASAMAVSGAAASSNMGASTIRPLTPTLALLNIRLGYWLRNPRRVNEGKRWNRWANFYFLLELAGLLNEDRRSVYLTDGGHIENLGIYELLRRRCKVIIAVDAEADPQMAFGSFNELVRYAVIDLGVKIELPWQQLSNMTKATGQKIDETGDAPKHRGPHVAVGEVCYPGGRRGILIYIKSSLTGDENDYIFHYKKRFSAFPHETTLDQFFSEEQFEAYRALGFHATHGFFDRRDAFAHVDPTENPCVRDDLAYLDKLFPLTRAADPCWPRARSTFVDWLSAPASAQAPVPTPAAVGPTAG
jgi:hypothetical protein